MNMHNVPSANGQIHVIEHEGVAAHPSDEGMKEIANRIINSINQ